jgi:phage tail-like protein
VAVQRDNPYPNFNFAVDIGLGDTIGFSEVDLPAGEIEVIEYREGNEVASRARKLPGLTKYANVTLKRGVAGDLELFEWWQSVRDGQLLRRKVVITLLDEQRQPVQRWVLRDAWPAKLDYSTLNARGNEVVIETLELAHEGFETE